MSSHPALLSYCRYRGTSFKCITHGGTVICTKDFIPSDFLFLLKTSRPTFYTAGPAVHQGILRQIKKVPMEALKNNSLRFIRSGSAALPPHLHHELETLMGVPLVDNYASSETGLISVNIPPGPDPWVSPVLNALRSWMKTGTASDQTNKEKLLFRVKRYLAGTKMHLRKTGCIH